MPNRYTMRIQYRDQNIQVTRHAIRRFQKRFEFLPDEQVVRRMEVLLGGATEVIPRTGRRGGRKSFANGNCVFVISQDAVIVTVLTRTQTVEDFADSVKDIRKEKRDRVRHEKRYRRPKPRKIKDRPHDDYPH